MEAEGIDIPDIADPPSSGVLTCAKYQKKYRRSIGLQKHTDNCGGPEPDKSVLSRGTFVVLGMLHRHDRWLYALDRQQQYRKDV